MDDDTRALVEEAAVKAAHQAVVDTLESLGFDPHDKLASQEEMVTLRHLINLFKDPEFRSNMEYITMWRKSVDEIKKKSVLTLVILLVTGTLGALVIGIKTTFNP